jgi:tetratricopeptide (TPR) repeat protein
VDFGHPNTWQRLWYHVSDAKDADYHFKGILNQDEFFYLVKIQLNNLVSPLFWPSLPFFALGLRYLWRYFQILSVAAVLLILINLGFFYYWIDGSSAFIPSICVYTIVSALGLGELGRFLRGKKVVRPLVSAAMALVTVTALVSMGMVRISERDTLSGYQSVELFFPDLSNVPPDSIIIHHTAWFSLLSLQYVYGARPDIPLVLMAGLDEPSYMTYPRPESMPLAHFPKDQNGNLVSPFVEGYANYFFNANMEKGKRIFMHYSNVIEPYLPYIEPSTEFMWMGELKQNVSAGLDAINNGSYATLLKRHREYFEAMHADPEQPVAPKAASYLFDIEKTILEYTYINRMYDITAETIKKYIDLFGFKNGKPAIPNDILLNSLALYANSCKKQGKFVEAEKAAATLMEIRPNYDLTYLFLGMLYDTQNKGQETLDAYRRATELNAYSRIAAIRYSTALAKYRTINDATAFLDGYIAFLDKAGLYNSKTMLSYHRRCLLLEPSKPELPEGNLLLKLFYEGVPNEANTDM